MIHPELLILCSIGLAHPAGAGAAQAQHALRTGKPRMALEAARKNVSRDPDNANAFAVLGAALTDVGAYTDALPALTLGLDSPVYEVDGIGRHADLLRAFGHGSQAARLRLQRPLVVHSDKAEILAYEGAIDDLRSAGDGDGAYDLALDALGIWPRSSLMHALMADVLTDLGDEHEAGFQLWLADFYGASPLRVELARARVALAENNLVDAEHIATRALRLSGRDAPELALRAEVARRQGIPEEALTILNRNNAGLSQQPDYMAIRVMVLADLGHTREARALLDHWRSVYPLDTGLLRAQAWLDR